MQKERNTLSLSLSLFSCIHSFLIFQNFFSFFQISPFFQIHKRFTTKFDYNCYIFLIIEISKKVILFHCCYSFHLNLNALKYIYVFATSYLYGRELSILQLYNYVFWKNKNPTKRNNNFTFTSFYSKPTFLYDNYVIERKAKKHNLIKLKFYLIS